LKKRLLSAFIFSSIVSFSALAFADCYIVIQSEVVNIQKRPHIKSEIVGKAPYKDVIWIEKIEGDWLYSPIKGGWIRKSMCKIFQTAREADDFAKHYWLAKSIEALKKEPGIRQCYIELILAKEITIGMNKEEVLFSWGKPNKRTISVYSFGTHETWVYRIADFKANYLFFDNNILKSYQLER
jgi:hypothetical protein